MAVELRDVLEVCHHCPMPSVPRPELVDFQNLTKSNARHNLEHAFSVAERHLGITPLLDPEGEVVAANPLPQFPLGHSRAPWSTERFPIHGRRAWVATGGTS